MKKFIYIIAFVFFFSACGKENTLTPSGFEKDFFDLSYLEKSNDPVDQARYDFWKETGISVFMDDTIGSSERVDEFGDTYTYYETLALNYSLGDVSGATYPELLALTELIKENYAAVIPALEFIKNELLSLVKSGGATYRSFYLVESLNSQAMGDYFFKGLNCAVFGKISQFANMTDAEKIAYKGQVANAIASPLIMSDEYSSKIDEFAQITRSLALYDYRPFYSYSIAANMVQIFSTGTSLEDVGFLGVDPTMPYYCPLTEETDVKMYVGEIFALEDDAGFRAKWGMWPRVIAKYEIIREILDELGF